jgi:hypothetical protein
MKNFIKKIKLYSKLFNHTKKKQFYKKMFAF